MNKIIVLLIGIAVLGCNNKSALPTKSMEIIESKGKNAKPDKFHIWAAADPHVTVDALHGVEPLQLAFRQSEGFWDFLPKMEIKLGGIPPAFDWD